MSENRTEKSGNHTGAEVRFMSAVVEASFHLRRLAEPRKAEDTVKSMIRRVSRLVGLPASRTEDLWRQEARLVRAEEMDAIRAAVRQRQEEEHARAEFRDLSRFIEAVEGMAASLRKIDPDFHGSQADGLVQSLGRPNRPVDR